MMARTIGNDTGAVHARATPFERFAGVCAILAGISGFLYAVAFVVLQSALFSGLFLMLTGLFTTAALVAVYERLRATDASFALLALLLGVAGALGSAVHGGYDLANVINPPPSMPDLPNPVDPRGLLTFGVAGAPPSALRGLARGGRHLPGGCGDLGVIKWRIFRACAPGWVVGALSTPPL